MGQWDDWPRIGIGDEGCAEREDHGREAVHGSYRILQRMDLPQDLFGLLFQDIGLQNDCQYSRVPLCSWECTSAVNAATEVRDRGSIVECIRVHSPRNFSANAFMSCSRAASSVMVVMVQRRPSGGGRGLFGSRLSCHLFSECQHEAEITSISPWAMRCVRCRKLRFYAEAWNSADENL